MKSASLQSGRTLLLACGVFLASGMVLSGIGPMLPFLANRSGQSVAALGAIFTALSAGVVLSQVAVGRASDRFGLRAVLAVGMALLSCGAIAIALSTAFVFLLLSAFLGGIGFGAILAAGNVLVARLYPDRSAAVLNGANVFYGVGSISGPIIAGFAGARLGAPYAALATGAAVLIVLVPWMLGRPPTPERQAATVAPIEHGRRSAGVLWLFGIVLLIYTGTEVGLGGWITVYLIQSARLAPEIAALGTSGFWLGLTVGRVLGAALGFRLTSSRLLLLSLAGLLAGALVLALGVGAQTLSIVGILLLGLACGPVFPTVLAVITGATQSSNRAAARVLTLGNSGGLVLPALIGALLGRYGPAAMTVVVLCAAAALLSIGSIAVLLLARSGRQGDTETQGKLVG